MFILMAVVFILGYICIALEHPLKIDKAATALLTGVLLWTIYIFGAKTILPQSPYWFEYLKTNPGGNYIGFITGQEIPEHLGEIAQIIFFLLGAMIIVEMTDSHEGFKIITDRIKTTNKTALIWLISFITFSLSSVLDNLTTTIVMIALIRKLMANQKDRWFMASLVVLAANAGGAWSPIGDVTTIMLWIGGQISAIKIIMDVFFASLASIVIPLIIVTIFYSKGKVEKPPVDVKLNSESDQITDFERRLMLILGVGLLLFVPVFKTFTHLPPYLGMLLGLSIIWIVTEIMHRKRGKGIRTHLLVSRVLRKVEITTVLFFLGILTAVAALQSAGHLTLLSQSLDKIPLDDNNKVFFINTAIVLISAIVDNVPLVAAAMGMYPIAATGSAGYLSYFMADGQFWELLAFTAGTGGSILIIGSAAGVAAMGLEKIDFIWYLKRISLLALAGYFSGILVYFLMFGI